MQQSVYKSYDELAAVPQFRNGGKGAGRVTIQCLRTHARAGLPGTACR